MGFFVNLSLKKKTGSFMKLVWKKPFGKKNGF